MKKLFTFLRSLFKHIYNGSPKSSQDLIDKRYSICLNCDFFDNRNYQCLQCGCNVNRKQILLNKLAWADQKCPLEKW